MNKWIVIVLLAGIAAYFGFKEPPGEFTASGDAKAVLFVVDGCPPCNKAAAFLKRSRMQVEVLKPMQSKAAMKRYKRFGTKQYPLLVVGKEQTVGFSERDYVEAMGRSFGFDAVPRKQQAAYKKHFRLSRPRVVMYGTAWCKFCAKARRKFDDYGIDYVEWNVEENSAAAARFKKLGGAGYPLIYVGFERMTEVDKSRINNALERSARPI